MKELAVGKRLQEELKALVKPYGGRASYGVAYIEEPQDDVTEQGEATAWLCAQRIEDVHASASMIKVLIMATVGELVRARSLAWDDRISLHTTPRVEGGGALQELSGDYSFRIGELCRLMMVLSDNWATNLLIKKIGMDIINETARHLGLTHTVLRRMMMDTKAQETGIENTTTVSDLMKLLTYLYRQRETDAVGMELWRILKRQQFRDKLPFYWGENIPFYHKTGCLNGVEHDGGIYLTLTGAYGIVVLLSEIDNAEGISCIAKMGQQIRIFIDEVLP